MGLSLAVLPEVATSAQVFCIAQFFDMDAFCREICSAFRVIALIAHALGVVLRICVFTLCYFSCLGWSFAKEFDYNLFYLDSFLPLILVIFLIFVSSIKICSSGNRFELLLLGIRQILSSKRGTLHFQLFKSSLHLFSRT